MQLHYIKIHKNEDILSIMSNLQHNGCLKVDCESLYVIIYVQ